MKKKKKTPKPKKITIALSERDYKKLMVYAQQKRKTKPAAARQLLHSQLSVLHQSETKSSKNQRGLVDSLQIDIFNATSKTED